MVPVGTGNGVIQVLSSLYMSPILFGTFFQVSASNNSRSLGQGVWHVTLILLSPFQWHLSLRPNDCAAFKHYWKINNCGQYYFYEQTNAEYPLRLSSSPRVPGSVCAMQAKTFLFKSFEKTPPENTAVAHMADVTIHVLTQNPRNGSFLRHLLFFLPQEGQ